VLLLSGHASGENRSKETAATASAYYEAEIRNCAVDEGRKEEVIPGA
jgi:hypothetical protein